MNAYYGCSLYAEVTGRSDEYKNIMGLSLAMEIQAASEYWHMKNEVVYDSIFAANRMVGNIGATDVTATTWFGAHPGYVHGINM